MLLRRDPAPRFVLTVALALSASLGWGSADFLAGLKGRRIPVLTVVLVSQVTGSLGILAVLAVRGEAPPAVHYLVAAALGGVAGSVGVVALYRALAVGSMSVVAPITAASAVIPVTVGLATGEHPATVQIAGMAVTLAGVVLTAREPRDAGGRRARATGVGLALLAAVMIGIAIVGLNAGSEGDALWAVAALRIPGTVVFPVAALVVRPPIRLAARDLGALVAVGLLDTGANAAFAVAASRGLLSLVAVLGQLYPVVTVVLARVVLRERIARSQTVGVLAALGGVGLIAAG